MEDLHASILAHGTEVISLASCNGVKPMEPKRLRHFLENAVKNRDSYDSCKS